MAHPEGSIRENKSDLYNSRESRGLWVVHENDSKTFDKLLQAALKESLSLW